MQIDDWTGATLLDHIVRVAVIFAAADGVIRPEELSIIARSAERRGLRVDPAELVHRLLEGRTPSEALDALAAHLPPNPIVHRTLFREAIFVCLADGELAQEEAELLVTFRERLGLSELYGRAMQAWCQAMLSLNATGVALIRDGDDALDDALLDAIADLGEEQS